MRIFGLLMSYFSVFGLAMLELWAAVPLGFVLKINPWLNGLLTFTGAMTGVAIAIFGGETIRKFIIKSKVKTQKSKVKGIRPLYSIIWNKYGVIGLGLLAPWITGAPLGAVLGLTLKADPKKLFFWLSVGVVLCVLVLIFTGIFTAGMITKK